jgi:uncharacterized DUF497 family protein
MLCMGVEWDSDKAISNVRKHGVDFADAAIALEDPNSITMEDPDAVDETRFVSIGMDPNGRVLITVLAYRDTIVRIISSRKASKQERRLYEAST